MPSQQFPGAPAQMRPVGGGQRFTPPTDVGQVSGSRLTVRLVMVRSQLFCCAAGHLLHNLCIVSVAVSR